MKKGATYRLIAPPQGISVVHAGQAFHLRQGMIFTASATANKNPGVGNLETNPPLLRIDFVTTHRLNVALVDEED